MALARALDVVAERVDEPFEPAERAEPDRLERLRHVADDPLAVLIEQHR